MRMRMRMRMTTSRGIDDLDDHAGAKLLCRSRPPALCQIPCIYVHIRRSVYKHMLIIYVCIFIIY